jgi:hypothetical protein
MFLNGGWWAKKKGVAPPFSNPDTNNPTPEDNGK